jgi:hypothetical protein
MAKRERPKLWVARDKGSYAGYNICPHPLKRDKDGYWWRKGFLDALEYVTFMGPDDFERISRIRLKPGEGPVRAKALELCG